jgi:hypothetical protein
MINDGDGNPRRNSSELSRRTYHENVACHGRDKINSQQVWEKKKKLEESSGII